MSLMGNSAPRTPGYGGGGGGVWPGDRAWFSPDSSEGRHLAPFEFLAGSLLAPALGRERTNPSKGWVGGGSPPPPHPPRGGGAAPGERDPCRLPRVARPARRCQGAPLPTGCSLTCFFPPHPTSPPRTRRSGTRRATPSISPFLKSGQDRPTHLEDWEAARPPRDEL